MIDRADALRTAATTLPWIKSLDSDESVSAFADILQMIARQSAMAFFQDCNETAAQRCLSTGADCYSLHFFHRAMELRSFFRGIQKAAGAGGA